MKELILDNPPRKKSKKRRSAAQRRATARMLAANRAKRRGSKSAKRRKSTKRRTKRTYSVKRRARRAYKSMARKSTRRRHKAHSRRRKTRTYLVRGSATPIKLNGLVGSIFSKDNLMVASGAVAGTIVSNYALNSQIATKLPMVTQPYARAAYLTLVPVIGGVLLRKVSPGIAKGMIIGGLVNGIAQLITASKVLPAGQAAPTLTVSPSTATTGEYLGEYLGGYNSDDSYLGEYLGDDFASDDDMNIESTGSFADSAW
jgi:hypothetical protein